MCVKDVEEGAQCTALRGASADADGWGKLGAYLHPMGAICQEVEDPAADGRRQSQSASLDASLWERVILKAELKSRLTLNQFFKALDLT